MRHFYTLLIFLSLCSISYGQVSGDNSVCEDELVNYFVPSVPGATYSWYITGGNFNGPSVLDNADIRWDAPGTGTIIVEVMPPSGPSIFHTLNVTINPNPKPVITHEPYASCPPDTSRRQGGGPIDEIIICEKVCKGATLTYSTPLVVGSSYSWIVTGESAISGAASNSATVTWDNTDFGSLVLVETNAFGCTDSTEICIEKIDLPIASFNNQASACKFSDIWLENTSIGATSYFWDFGDGYTSTDVEPNHAYASGGTYTITLIAQNDCFCADTTQHNITINSLAGPDISCPSTICAFDTVEYTASGDVSCTFNWFAIGGTITGGQGTPTVSVAWGPGDMGTLGLYLSGCSGVCMDTTFIDIPIVPSAGVISGASEVCAGNCETYSMPYFSGATYKWSLSSGCGILQDSTCCETVQICWPNYLYSCTDTLNVTYFDSFLNCGGSAQFIINLRPKYQVYGQSAVCSNDISFFSTSSFSSYWSISPAGPILSASPSNSINIDWNGYTGDFILSAAVADPSEVCMDSSSLPVHVTAPPAPPLIVGDTLICPNSSSVYCAPGSTTNVNWLITGGSPSTAISNCITVNWNASGPYLVQAFETLEKYPKCESDTSTLNVQIATGTNPVLTGPTSDCANATSVYSTSTIYPASANYNWKVNPSIDGAILSPNSASTSIEWGNNAPGSVWVSLSVEVCGVIYADSVNVTLNPIPVPVITQLSPLCDGGSADLSVSAAYTSYNWSGPAAYTSASNPATIFDEGLYQVSVTDANGCAGKSSLKVTNVSGPNASISSPDFLRHCIGSAYSVDICALGNPDYTYAWSTGATSQCITTTSTGTFKVTVTDIVTGCVSISDNLSVVEYNCNTTVTCQPNGSISFTDSGCNPIVFNNTSVSGSNFAWYFGDGNTSAAANPTHTYAMAGFYLVELYGDVPNISGTGFCRLSDTAVVEVPLSANFDLVFGCNGEAVCFTDMSTYTAGNSISNWSWNFGDGNTSTLQDPCHTYLSDGTYTVVLTISNATCSVSFSETFTIDPSPTASFSFPSPNCTNVAVPFTDASFTSIDSWSWNFGDGGTSLNQNPNHSYAVAGDYTVDLLVADIYGCEGALKDTVEIVNPFVPGTITAYPDTIVCEGTDVLLVAPSCGSCTYLWSNGSTNDSIVVNSTGIYTLEMDNGSGCPGTTFKRIIVTTAPVSKVINNGSRDICLGESIFLEGTYSPNWNYEWISDDGVNNGASYSSIYFMPNVAGDFTYQLIVTDINTGCTDTSLAYVVTVHDKPANPVISPIGAAVVCEGESVALVGSHPDPTVSLQWSTGEISDTINVTENGCYKLIATDSNGCTSNVTYCVTVNPLPDLCAYYVGCFDTCAPYTIIGPVGGTSYQWFMNGSPILGATAKDYTTSTSGAYALAVTNSFGCADTTGELELNLTNCSDTLCASFVIDSIFCDADGNYTMLYHVINNSLIPVDRINLEVLSPYLGLLYGPVITAETILAGDTSSQLSTTIYNGNPGDVICFRTHLDAFSTAGEEICCFSDSACIVLPPCNSNCCRADLISDTVWCEQTSVGTKYYFDLLIDGCGTLYMSSTNPGALNVSSPYNLVDGLNTVSGSYIANPGESALCLTYYVTDDMQQLCADTTICLKLICDAHPKPCEWQFKREVCVGHAASFYYTGSTAGLLLDWSFPTGSPSTATGAGTHSVVYNTPGTYPVTLTLTNSAGVTECVDSITVLAGPTASISEGVGGLYAHPSGMNYQWYEDYPWSLLFGENNQYYNATNSGNYCVVVTDMYGCADTACIKYSYVGIDELELADSWNVYPNPNQGSFNLEVDVKTSGKAQFKVISILGKVIDQREFILSPGTQKFFISNANFSAGVYFIELQTEEGKSVKRMLID